jgi:hypothetical protein
VHCTLVSQMETKEEENRFKGEAGSV